MRIWRTPRGRGAVLLQQGADKLPCEASCEKWYYWYVLFVLPWSGGVTEKGRNPVEEESRLAAPRTGV